MSLPAGLTGLYVAVLGAGMLCLGFFELIFPAAFFRLWEAWSRHRMFFLHGIILVIGGFPLTIYQGAFSTFIFIIGVFFVISGPFILIYPEKFGRTFEAASREMKGEVRIRLIYLEALFRIATGSIFVASFFS
jgi:hypothetical protein